MLAIRCIQCGQFSILGYENEFGEHFCSEDCYKWHCLDNGYLVSMDKFKPIEALQENNKKSPRSRRG